MAASTMYDVGIRLRLQDEATKRAWSLERAMSAAAKSGGGLRSALGSIGTIAAGAFGARAAAGALVGFNSNLEQARIQMAGMIQLTKGGEWTGNLEKANVLVRDLQLRARESVGTTEDMVHMAGMITRPVLAAGLGMKDLELITSRAVVAAKSFGVEADVAARDIDQMLMGRFNTVDVFSAKLLAPWGFVGEAGRAAFRKLDESARASLLLKALNHPAIQAMAKAQGQSFEGQTSTFKDNIQIALGKVGLPLTKAITAELVKWNTWLDANQATVERWVTTAGTMLLDGFGVLKDVVAFLDRNKDTLLTIAKVWVGARVGGGVVAGVAGMFASFSGGIMGAVNGLALLAAASVAAADWFGEGEFKENERNFNAGHVTTNARQFNLTGDRQYLRMLLSEAKDMGALAGGNFDERAFRTKVLGMSPEEASERWRKNQSFWTRQSYGADQFADTFRGLDTAVSLLKTTFETTAKVIADTVAWEMPLRQIATATEFARGLAGGMPDKVAKRPQVNVTIQRIEIVSDDPDRFAFHLTETLRDMAANPSTSRIRRGLREGG